MNVMCFCCLQISCEVVLNRFEAAMISRLQALDYKNNSIIIITRSLNEDY
ncbi:hypothetical protein Hdeb2414_s0026g00678731 [Helianthus debilis subsp. tardiflorus]